MKKRYNPRNIFQPIKLYSLTLIACVLSFTNKIYTQTLPDGFKVEKVAAMSYPTAYAFAPDGRIFVCEEAGTVNIIKDGVKLSTNFYQLSNVFSQYEKGLIGIAIDPDFNNNHYVYLHYTHDNGGPTGRGVQNRVVRLTANGDVADGPPTKILDLDSIPAFMVNYNHDGGSLEFGSDGKLYITSGENTLWCACSFSFPTNRTEGCYVDTTKTKSPTCKLPGLGNFSQDMDHYVGKLIRINSDGSAPSDNPLASSSSEVQKRIVAKGLRNPFTMHLRKGTNMLYINDVGSSDYAAREETNIFTIGGKSIINFGWDNYEGYTNASGIQGPLHAYPHAVYSNNAFSDSTGCAITGGIFFDPTTTNYPSQYKGKYFYQDFCGGWINYLNDETGRIKTTFATGLSGNPDISGNGGIGSLALNVGNDGNLYFMSRGSDSKGKSISGLYRITYSNPASVSAAAAKFNLNVYPNPANSSVTVSFSDDKSESIKVVIQDLLSRERLTYKINSISGVNNVSIDISSLEKGAYTVTLNSGDLQVTKKLLVE